MADKKKGFQITKEVRYTLGEAAAPPEELGLIFLRPCTVQEKNEYTQVLMGVRTEDSGIATAYRAIFDKCFKRAENLMDGDTKITSAQEIPDEYACDIGVRHMNRTEVIDVKNY